MTTIAQLERIARTADSDEDRRRALAEIARIERARDEADR